MGPGGFFPTNPNLADMLGDTDLDFENFIFLFFGIHNFQISRFQISRNLAWARLGPGLGQAWGRNSWRTLRGSSAAPPDHKVGEI